MEELFVKEPKKTIFIAKKEPRRGDLYFADLGGSDRRMGSEQKGCRPVLILQNDTGNRHSPTTIAAILTTKRNKDFPTHVTIKGCKGLKYDSTVCLEQLLTIDKSRLGVYLGSLPQETMQQVDAALAVSLGMYAPSFQRP